MSPLDDGSVATLLCNAFGAPPDQALSSLAGVAAGNASLLAELARGLVEEEAVLVTNERAVLTSPQLPRRMHLVAESLLVVLSKQARLLVLTTAVLGSSFVLEDAAEMLNETPASLLPAVEEAMDAGIIAAADDAFSFPHELLRCALSEVVPRPARSALHRHYGRILLDRGETPSLAAAHLLSASQCGSPALLADLDAAAVQTLPSAPQVAADLALRALNLTPPGGPSAFSRALAATEALTAAGRLGEAACLADKTLATPLPPAGEARLRCALSSVLCSRGRVSEATDQADMVLSQPHLPSKIRGEALTARLLALGGRQHGSLAADLANTILAHASEHESHTVSAALVSHALVAWDGGHINQALAMLRDAARRGSAVSPDARHPQPLLALADALVSLRQFVEADKILQAADQPALRDIPAHSDLLLLRARMHLANGGLADAEATAQAALASAEKLEADGHASAARTVLAQVALRRGDIAVASHHVTVLPLRVPRSFGLCSGSERAFVKAQLREMLDGPYVAMSQIREASAHFPISQGLLLSDPVVAPWLVRTSLAAGEEHLAQHVSAGALALADGCPGLPGLSAAAAHSRGLASGNAGLLAEAAARHPDPWARASATEDLAVLLTSTAKDEAIRHLKRALEEYGRTGAERDQARIRHRLRKLGARCRHWRSLPDRPVTGWDSLTETEQAIARLVAEGLNNREVAGRVFISTHTVAHHLHRSFRKLQITSRVELARIVIEQAAGGP